MGDYVRSARPPAVPNLVQIGSWGSSGEMCEFLNYHSFLYAYIYTVNHKKGGSAFVIITFENLDRFFIIFALF